MQGEVMATDANQDLDRLLCNPQFVDDPYLIYHRLREEAPVFWSSGWNAWVLTRYADVVATLRDSAHFSNAGRMPLLTSGLSDQTQAQMGLLQHHFAQGLIHTDPPNHTRLRGLVNTAFTPRVVEQIRPQVEALVNNLLDAVQHSGRMEIIRDLAYPVPAVVVAMMLGVPAEDRDLFKHWSDEIITLQESDRLTPEIVRRCRSSIEEMKAYFGDLLLFRRSHPMDDLLGNLAAVEVQGQVLNSDELLATCVTLLIAGHETTTSLIASGLLTLLQHPDQMER